MKNYINYFPHNNVENVIKPKTENSDEFLLLNLIL